MAAAATVVPSEITSHDFSDRRSIALRIKGRLLIDIEKAMVISDEPVELSKPDYSHPRATYFPKKNQDDAAVEAK